MRNSIDTIIEAIETETMARTSGLSDEARHQALLVRWRQLCGMRELALLAGIAPELRRNLETLSDEIVAELKAAA